MAGSSSRNAYEHSAEDNRSINSELSSFGALPRHNLVYASSQTIVSVQSLHQEELNQWQAPLVTTPDLEANNGIIAVGGLPGPVLLAVDPGPSQPLPSVPFADVERAPFFADESVIGETFRSGRTTEITDSANQQTEQTELDQQSNHEETILVPPASPASSRVLTRSEILHQTHTYVENEIQGPSFALQEQSTADNWHVCTGEPEETKLSQEDKKTVDRPSLNKCEKHKEELRYFCNSCQMSVCENCWELDHQDATQHHVILFKFKLKQQNEFFERIKKYVQQTIAIEQLVNQLHAFLEQLPVIKEKQEEVMKSRNNEELMNRAQFVKELLDVQLTTVDSLHREITEELAIAKSSLENLLMPENDRQLGTLSKKFVSEENVWCRQAIYNSNSQKIYCSNAVPDVIQIANINTELNSLVFKRTLRWKELRRDEWSELRDIAMTSDNTLYASIYNRRYGKVRVSVLNQSDLSEEREIDTCVIRENQREGFTLHLSACGNKLAVVTRLHNCRDITNTCERMYIYSEERCTHIVRLGIHREVSLFFVCYIGSHLIVPTSYDTLAVVPLDDINSSQQNKTTREKMRKNSHKESGQLEESRASGIKHITLLDTESIRNMVWMGRDDKELDGRIRRTSADGYLFVGDCSDSDWKCSLYELDLDRVKNGERVNRRKDLEMKEMFPKCRIDNSNLFAIQGNKIVEGKPTIVALEYN